jgi:hypothetical protein
VIFWLAKNGIDPVLNFSGIKGIISIDFVDLMLDTLIAVYVADIVL